jgi:signal transduction histidine kinase
LGKYLVGDQRLRRTGLSQVLILILGLAVLVAISAASIYFVYKAREDAEAVTHTVEVEGQISTVLLEIRRAESAVRAYLLSSGPQFLREYEEAAARILPAADKLTQLTSDNPAQAENNKKLRKAIETRLAEFARGIDRVKNNDTSTSAEILRQGGANEAAQEIVQLSADMRKEEGRLFAARNISADQSQRMAAMITTAGSGIVIALAGLSIALVRRASRERDKAEQLQRDINIHLENTVQERTADLREANEEVQRFAYIVSHDLRSPLVNIMGFTSELEELRTNIFKRLAAKRAGNDSGAPAEEPALEGEDKQLSDDFTEALGFIKSSIGKMDRQISAILNLTREGRRQFRPERIDLNELMQAIVTTVAHQTSEASADIRIEALPDVTSDRLALEQIFSNLIDNALKYLKDGTPGEITVRGRRKLGFAVIDVIDNGRGIDPRDHQRIFDLFRRAGTQDKPGQGIGLAHVRALVRRLGGTLNVSSELNQGSTFTVTLPINWTAESKGQPA